ncbi:Xaa-Pro aminopeptidase [Halomonas sp. HL-93]|uniref:Xaa-Pro aminopeptidase n=1 Tax=Halomonas sp. HL-93 TaxID=1666906 RepID=UPI0006DB3FD3|nr:Xaa-Pro aminopeptidase [Halomonas sp. HL-93]KPQ20320.1 MAG: Xaa-Pro aminopeptidase PepP [Halomonas sp. HL-93]SBR52439.1 aminopeptidase P . Metallo peptidase. MEROPS family M24B [Halomonas sp. HL-93]
MLTDVLPRPPAITRAEYHQRRDTLMAQLLTNAAVILPGGSLVTRSNDSEYTFRQSSDFYYLTGISEPDALLVLLPGREAGQSVVFCQDRDPTMEAWTGRRLGAQGVITAHGIDQAFENAEREAMMPELLAGRELLYLPLDHDGALDIAEEALSQAKAGQRRGLPALKGWMDVNPLIHAMRQIKSEAEIALLRHATAISAHAHVRAMCTARPGLSEYQLQAELEHEFVWQGGSGPAYSTIVGGGANACVLHYIENSAPLADGELVLIDAGAEFELYAGDITRTFPVSGRFNDAQRALYQVVLHAQERAVAAIQPGVTLADIHKGVVADLTAGLIELGLLEGELQTCIDEQHYRRFYLHSTSHWLGLDVHDVGTYRLNADTPRPLEPGMVLTVEPGLYIPDETDIPVAYRGIGIRIEDNVVVTNQGHEVLTDQVPKRVADIEALMASD